MSTKTVIILTALGALFLYSKTGQAQGLQCTADDNTKVDIVQKCPKVKERWRTVVKKVEVPKIVEKTVVKTVKVPVTKIKYIKQVQKRKYVKTKEVNVRKNHLTVLVGASDTKLEATKFDDHVSRAKNSHEFDIGLQYMREFDIMNLGVTVTRTGQAYLGIGLSW